MPDHPQQGDSCIDDDGNLWVYDEGEWIEGDTFYHRAYPEGWPPVIYRPE